MVAVNGILPTFTPLSQTINIQGEALQLLPQRAVYWAKEKTLIASDLHWGKTGHFRKNGIAIPANTQHTDEIRLANLIEQTGAERLIIAGDFFHSRENNETKQFTHWRNAHAALDIVLVMGNHDILPKESYEDWNLTIYDNTMDVGAFVISHDVLEQPEKFYLHGHIHPSCKVKGKTRFSVTLPCFCIDDARMALPSFGQFTGSKKIHPPDYRQVYVIAEDAVVQVR